MFAMFFFCTLYLQKVLGYAALETGVAFLPMTLLIVLCSRFAAAGVAGAARGADARHRDVA